MFQQPDEAHHVSEPPVSSYQRGYERGYAWAQKRRESILQYTGVIASVVGLLIVTVLTGVYGFGWQNTLSYLVSYPLPMPAATIDGKPIWYTDYMQQINYTKTAHSYRQQNEAGNRSISRVEVNAYAMDRLVFRNVLREAAEEYDVSVSDDEVRERFQSLYTGQTNQGRLAAESGVSHDILRQRARTDLLRQKLEHTLKQNGTLGQDQSITDWINQRIRNKRVTYWLPQLGR